MKCKHCNGTGTTNWCVNGTFVDCPYCGGTGVMEGNMTNEEWRKTCSTEEFAEALTKVVLNIVSWNNDPKPSEVRHILKSWLKQPHEQKGD